MSQINVAKAFTIEIFKTYFICHCPEAIMKKLVQVNCIAIGLEVLDDGPIFFGIARCQERVALFAKIDEQNKRKWKYAILFIKYL